MFIDSISSVILISFAGKISIAQSHWIFQNIAISKSIRDLVYNIPCSTINKNVDIILIANVPKLINMIDIFMTTFNIFNGIMSME